MATVSTESRHEERNMQHEQHSGVARYVIVWVALIAGTIITVMTGRMHLPTWGLALALFIATVKGTLVAMYFMHLVDHAGANRLVFGVSILFVLLMLFFPLVDFGTRFRGSNPPGSPHSDLQAIQPVIGGEGGRFGGMLKPPEDNERHE